jgi:hypothetical protein
MNIGTVPSRSMRHLDVWDQFPCASRLLPPFFREKQKRHEFYCLAFYYHPKQSITLLAFTSLHACKVKQLLEGWTKTENSFRLISSSLYFFRASCFVSRKIKWQNDGAEECFLLVLRGVNHVIFDDDGSLGGG